VAKIGSVIDGKYEILTEIGHGGMSVVYLAMDTHLNKQWAVKEIRKKGTGKNDEIIVNSLLTEANLMKRLDHPALPRIVDIIDTGVTIFVVMDYIEGESLDKILAEYGTQSEELVIGWAKQICDALSYLHSQKPPIIYRDMKPANIMLKPEGNIKIIDFGIAREYKEKSLADTTVLGTKGYAPPEQYSGQTDARSDIYALGMTMHHLLTGIDPRSGEAYAPVRMWNPEVSEGLELIIDKCVQPAAENRYQTCQDLLYDLEHPELITKGYKKKQKRKLALFLIFVILAIIMGMVGVVCNLKASELNNATYESLINMLDSSISTDEKFDSFKEAVELYPERTEAYEKMIDAYKTSGTFTKEDNDEFSSIYAKYQDQLDSESESVAELNYSIGMLYFNFYKENDDQETKFSTKVGRAKTYFEKNYNLKIEYEDKTMSDCFYLICKFYTDYIADKAEEDPSKEDYDELINQIKTTMDNMDTSDVADYKKVTFYHSIFTVLYDQRKEMAEAGVDLNTILNLYKDIYEKAKNVSTTKFNADQLKNDITEHYSDYKNLIELEYE
jgi:serine/threonine-protein kinase